MMSTKSKTGHSAPTSNKKLTKAQEIAKQRTAELEKYFHGLQALDDYTSGRISTLPPKILSGDFIKIAKASSFLLLYNYIEGCVLQAFTEIYDEIKQSGIPYSELRKEFQKIWIAHRTKPLLIDPTSSHNSYNEIANTIIDNIVNKECISLDRKALPISGNLSERKIKSVCDLHGIKLPSKISNAEDEMEIIMTMRNDLAHGSISFGECGRSYTVSDLARIKNISLSYIEILINSIDSFSLAKRYKSAP